jgi:phosphoribosylpyrophosphate synthetase
MGTTGGIKVFSGNANPKLAEEICRQLSCDMGKSFPERFSDGEFNFQIDENVRGGDVFLVGFGMGDVEDREFQELLARIPGDLAGRLVDAQEPALRGDFGHRGTRVLIP